MAAAVGDLAVGDLALAVERDRKTDRSLFLGGKGARWVEFQENVPVGRVLDGLLRGSLSKNRVAARGSP